MHAHTHKPVRALLHEAVVISILMWEEQWLDEDDLTIGLTESACHHQHVRCQGRPPIGVRAWIHALTLSPLGAPPFSLALASLIVSPLATHHHHHHHHHHHLHLLYHVLCWRLDERKTFYFPVTLCKPSGCSVLFTALRAVKPKEMESSLRREGVQEWARLHGARSTTDVR